MIVSFELFLVVYCIPRGKIANWLNLIVEFPWFLLSKHVKRDNRRETVRDFEEFIVFVNEFARSRKPRSPINVDQGTLSRKDPVIHTHDIYLTKFQLTASLSKDGEADNDCTCH
ncbi:hypothetical protein L1887_03591 [Cichorium endivia]|nr:hypothetical protein L1887_03591 [Cichorium endivia]